MGEFGNLVDVFRKTGRALALLRISKGQHSFFGVIVFASKEIGFLLGRSIEESLRHELRKRSRFVLRSRVFFFFDNDLLLVFSVFEVELLEHAIIVKSHWNEPITLELL